MLGKVAGSHTTDPFSASRIVGDHHQVPPNLSAQIRWDSEPSQAHDTSAPEEKVLAESSAKPSGHPISQQQTHGMSVQIPVQAPTAQGKKGYYEGVASTYLSATAVAAQPPRTGTREIPIGDAQYPRITKESKSRAAGENKAPRFRTADACEAGRVTGDHNQLLPMPC